MHITQMTAAELAAIAAAPRSIKAHVAQVAEKAKVGAAERSVAERIADDMIDIAGAQGNCLDRDLIGRGWRPEALKTHGDEANRIALARAGDAR